MSITEVVVVAGAKRVSSVRLDEDARGVLKRLAAEHGCSESDVVAEALLAFADVAPAERVVVRREPVSAVCPAPASIRVGGVRVDTTDPANVPVNEVGESREAFYARISAGRMSFGSGKKA